MSPKLAMRKRVRQKLLPTTPEEGETPKPEKQRVVHRYRVPPEQYLGGSTSTATELLEKVVGKPPEKIKEPVDAVTLSKLGDAYGEYEYNPGDSHQKNYESALSLLSGLNPTETTIQAFINQKLPAHQQEGNFQNKAGIFLSAVIQTSSNQKITLDVTKVRTLDDLCCFLENKEVTIIGDAGDWTVIGAKSGSVTVKGNTGYRTGWRLKGASVTVEGDTGHDTATDAKSGSVIVKGNTGDRTGEGLQGASVTVEGNAGNKTGFNAKSGSITVKGNTGDGTGRELEGASVTVEGDAGDDTAIDAKSGEIRVGGKIKSLWGDISPNVKVFEAGQQIWPKTKMDNLP